MQTSDLERWIRRDPAGRKILASSMLEASPCAGHLAVAADELAKRAKYVAIVTGFFVPDAPIPTSETDGPLGATLLADVLHHTGIETYIITDENCASGVRAAMKGCGVGLELLVCPIDPRVSSRWRADFWQSPLGRSLTHLISVERVGPSRFDAPEEAKCRNVRGMAIDAWAADLYRLFEDHPKGVRTIGIGDGGNEIGMGTFWDDPVQSLDPPGNACRTRTDWTILAGVSDWGAMALATLVAMQRDQARLLRPWTSDRLEAALEHLVKAGPAIDGCTLQPAATIDGLPFATYIQPWAHIRTALALDS